MKLPQLNEAECAKSVPELEVLREYTGQNGMREWNDVGAWLRPGECIAVVTAPKPTQAEKQEPYKRGMTLQECADAEYQQEPAKDEPVCGCCDGTGRMVRDPDIGTDQECFVCNGSGVCEQEPVKDEPVAWRFSKGTITKLDSCRHGGNWQPLYTRPQPDLTAEVERLHQVCRDAYEVWAGSNGIPEPITCAEAYLLQLLIQMRDEVKRGLK